MKRNAKASRRRCEERKKKRAETDTKKNTDRHGQARTNTDMEGGERKNKGVFLTMLKLGSKERDGQDGRIVYCVWWVVGGGVDGVWCMVG